MAVQGEERANMWGPHVSGVKEGGTAWEALA
jgi:hypothetical protein